MFYVYILHLAEKPDREYKTQSFTPIKSPLNSSWNDTTEEIISQCDGNFSMDTQTDTNILLNDLKVPMLMSTRLDINDERNAINSISEIPLLNSVSERPVMNPMSERSSNKMVYFLFYRLILYERVIFTKKNQFFLCICLYVNLVFYRW